MIEERETERERKRKREIKTEEAKQSRGEPNSKHTEKQDKNLTGLTVSVD